MYLKINAVFIKFHFSIVITILSRMSSIIIKKIWKGFNKIFKKRISTIIYNSILYSLIFFEEKILHKKIYLAPKYKLAHI